MHIFELFLDEMSDNEYQIFSRKAIEEFKASGIELILTRHVADQVAYNTERGDMVTPEIFIETLRSILKAFNERKLGKYIYMAGKKPEAHALFKHKFQGTDGKINIANVPCAIAKIKTPPFMFKFTIITFMVKDNYQNDNFPDSPMIV